MRGSRRGSPQSAHGSVSEKLPHVLQKPTRSRTSRIESASRSASSFGTRSRWSASRWALFVPMLGSFSSSAISNSRYFELCTRARRSERQVEAARDLGIGLGHLLLRGALRLADRRDHQVLEQRDVLLVEDLRGEFQLLQHLLAVHDGLDEPAAGRGLVALLGQLGLELAHLLLHLLRLLHHVAEALHWPRSPPRPARSGRSRPSVRSGRSPRSRFSPRSPRSIPSPSNTCMARSMIGLRLSAFAARCSGVSGAPAVHWSRSVRPNERASSSWTMARASGASSTERWRSSMASTSSPAATPTSFDCSRNAPSMRFRPLTALIVACQAERVASSNSAGPGSGASAVAVTLLAANGSATADA